MSFFSKVKSVIPNKIKVFIKKPLQKIIFKHHFKKIKVSHSEALQVIKKKSVIKVVFFVIHESVWKYDEIYRLMDEDSRFEPVILICPYTPFGDEVMLRDMERAYRAFSDQGLNVKKSYDTESDQWIDVKETLSPDIVFFTNPWNLTKKEFLIENYLDRLTCYVPYGFKNSYLYEAHFNKPMQNLTWRFFVETTIHKALAEKYSRNEGCNVIVTGFPGMDRLLIKSKTDTSPWKIKDSKHKKVIWAPHHTIPNYGATLDYSTFLKYAEYMFEIANTYKDKIQLAFKPHPILRSKLEQDSVWGKKRTDDYFERWANLENGILVEGSYITLFETSDALLNDSSSFVIEYLYTGKPMLFLLESEEVLNRFNEVGDKAISHSYIARNTKEIVSFLNDVVIDDNDIHEKERQSFFEGIIKPPNNKTASKNIFDHIKKELLQ